MSQLIDGRHGGLHQGTEGLEVLLGELRADRIVPDETGFVPAFQQGLVRGYQAVAAGIETHFCA